MEHETTPSKTSKKSSSGKKKDTTQQPPSDTQEQQQQPAATTKKQKSTKKATMDQTDPQQPKRKVDGDTDAVVDNGTTPTKKQKNTASKSTDSSNNEQQPSKSTPAKTTAKKASTPSQKSTAGGKPHPASKQAQPQPPAQYVQNQNDWEVALSQENLETYRLSKNEVKPSSQYSEASYRLIFPGVDRSVKSRTAIMHIDGSNLHGVGVGDAKKMDENPFKYKVKCSTQYDEKILEEDPSLVETGAKFDDAMIRLKERCGRLLWEAPDVKQKRKEDLWVDAMKQYIMEHDDVKQDPEFAKLLEELKKPVNKRADLSKKEWVNTIRALKTNPEVENIAVAAFTEGMSNWYFAGNDKLPADDPKKPTYRLKSSAFFRKKLDNNPAGGKKGETSNNSDRIRPAAKGGQKAAPQPLTDADDDAGKTAASDEATEEESEESRSLERSDDEVQAIIKKMDQLGFRHTKIEWYDVDGRRLAPILGKNANNPNFRVVDQNYYAIFEFAVYMYSDNKADGRYGMKLMLQYRAWYVKDGIPNRDIPQPVNSKIKSKYVVREQEKDASKQEEGEVQEDQTEANGEEDEEEANGEEETQNDDGNNGGEDETMEEDDKQ